MEPVSVMDEDDLRLRQYENTPYCMNPTEVDELIGQYVTTEEENSNTPRDAQNQFTILLKDFDDFESTMLSPPQMESINVQNFGVSGIAGEVEDGGTIIKDRTEKARQNFVENDTCASQNANVTNHNGGAGGGGSDSGGRGMVGSFLKCENVITYNGGGRSIGGGITGSLVKYTNVASYVRGDGGGGGMLTGSLLKYSLSVGNSRWVPPRSKKRKYRGVIETEAETAIRVERNKIKNRVSAEKAVKKKQAYENYLKAQVKKLCKEVAFRKNMLKFLEDNPVKLTPRRLKRTFSGPI